MKAGEGPDATPYRTHYPSWQKTTNWGTRPYT